MLLFIDSAVRSPELSRTTRLCEAYLAVFRRVHPEYDIQHIRLMDEHFSVTTWEEVQERENPVVCSKADHPLLRHARRFASADRILIGAPYWDLSFPAILKQYLEKVCVLNIVFKYAETGIVPCCRAQRMTYLTACGGKIPAQTFGAGYLKGLCETLFGIHDFEWEGAELLDIAGNDPEQIMAAAKKRVEKLAERL